MVSTIMLVLTSLFLFLSAPTLETKWFFVLDFLVYTLGIPSLKGKDFTRRDIHEPTFEDILEPVLEASSQSRWSPRVYHIHL